MWVGVFIVCALAIVIGLFNTIVGSVIDTTEHARKATRELERANDCYVSYIDRNILPCGPKARLCGIIAWSSFIGGIYSLYKWKIVNGYDYEDWLIILIISSILFIISITLYGEFVKSYKDGVIDNHEKLTKEHIKNGGKLTR